MALMARAAVLLLLAVATRAEPAQPPPQRPPRDEPGEMRRQPPLDRDAVRARLTRRLNDARAMLARLEAAVERLDSGAPLSDVLAELNVDAPPFGQPDSPAPGGRRSGPRGGDGGPEHRPPGPPPQDKAGRAAVRVREFVRRHLPGLAEEFERHAPDHPGEPLIAWLAPQIAELESARQRDDVLFEARIDEIRSAIEVGRRVRELRLAVGRPGATPESLREHLDAVREALGDQFDARLRVQRREIELLLQRVERLKADTERRQADRERLLDERMAEIEAMTPRRRDEPPSIDRP
jgi:hypothetical protein